jgi:alpha-L-fucosidase 2
MMKLAFLLLAFVISFLSSAQEKKIDPLKLWYDKPATIWEEALPLGNGKTGAMVFGGVNTDHIQLNDKTLWSGFPDPGNNPKGPANLPRLRKAVIDGQYGEAAEIWKKNFQGPYSARYLTMADLYLHFHYKDSTTSSYQRQLNIKDAVHTITYSLNGVSYNRETIISYPDKVIAVRLTANKKNSISFSTGMTSKLRYSVAAFQSNYLVLKGKAPKHVAHRSTEPQQIVYDDQPKGEGMNFEVHVQIKAEGGTVKADGKELRVSNANAVTIYLTEATSFNGFLKSPGLEGRDPSLEAKSNMKNAFARSWAVIKAAHISDYKKLFDRVSFQLAVHPEKAGLPTNVRMAMQSGKGNDQEIQVLYYQYGRYLMIASSRPGSLPSNLQGIWNDLVQPPWGSNYTTNINVQMNYWPAENANLSELHQPLFNWMKNLAINGAKTARVNYGINEGWVLHHNSDIWAKTSPTGGYDWDPRGAPRWSAWPMGAAWLSTHLFEHYLYTGDKNFLREEAYPLMKGAAQFMLHWLVEDRNGYLVTNPSTSPENVFTLDGKAYEVSMATTMDMSIIRELFTICLEAGRQLKTDGAFELKLETAKSKLYPYHIGRHGQLQEWFLDWDDPKDSHRHLSHLYGLYPGNQITIKNSPELAAAAKRSMIHRGDVSTGWSMAWKMNWWARLRDGDHAFNILKAGLILIDPAGNTKTSIQPEKDSGQLTAQQSGGGGTYPNLFDAHPPFQIDGNFGATAGITEMLMQSHEGEINLLPALPKEWSDGHIKGIKARGNFKIDISWKEGRLTQASIHSFLGGNCRIRTSVPVKVVEARSNPASGKNPNQLLPEVRAPKYIMKTNANLEKISDEMGYVIDFTTEKGKTYTIVPKDKL